MNHALRIAIIQTTCAEPAITKRETINVSHFDGKLLPEFIVDAKQQRRTGQLVINYSQGSTVSAQWIEKITS